ncbi:MAG: hypothetical protein ACOYIF_09405 [Acetivibrionales bacterium]|jgi:hypothetical protein
MRLLIYHIKPRFVVQALKALGKGNVTDKELQSISKLLSDNEKAQMFMEAKRVTAWVYATFAMVESNTINSIMALMESGAASFYNTMCTSKSLWQRGQLTI